MKILSIKDRFKLFVRLFKLIVTKEINYVNILWKNEKGDVLTHTFYADGTDPKEPFLEYIATVVGGSKDLDSLNNRAEYFLNKAVVGYCLLNDRNLENFKYKPEPIVEIEAE